MSLRTTAGGSAGTLRLKLLELVGQPHAHQVGPGAEELAQLDEGRPQFGHRHAQAGFPGMPGDGGAAAGLQQVLGEIRPQPPDPRRQLVLAQHRQDLVPAAQVAVDLRDRAELHGTDDEGKSAGPLPASLTSPRVVIHSFGVIGHFFHDTLHVGSSDFTTCILACMVTARAG